MKDIRPARPKNLATKTVAWPWASGLSIHCKHGRKIQVSLHPLRSTLHPLQLISTFCLSQAPFNFPFHMNFFIKI
uniref:Uncharacterized protein MANES_13G113000 n=1 Tax=Rhizophora mucronata TaxID=61149 RepID=A0A2P2L5U0_RHIMU